MKKTFKVGDRVNSPEGKGKVLCTHKSEAWISIDGKDFCCTFYFSRLKKLKPKPKREPRRVWINSFILENKDFDVVSAYKSKSNYDDDYDADAIEFIEVIK